MIFCIAVVVIALIVIVCAIVFAYDDGFLYGVWTALWTSVIGFIVLLLVAAILSGVSGGAPVYKTETSTTNLQAVSNGSDLSGHFFLGSGSVKDEKMFSYLYKENGWTRTGQQKASQSFVAEDANVETARLDKVEIYRNYWWAGQANVETRYEFHIPKNSVVENFKIEAK